jgi:hypothetical protein
MDLRNFPSPVAIHPDAVDRVNLSAGTLLRYELRAPRRNSNASVPYSGRNLIRELSFARARARLASG